MLQCLCNYKEINPEFGNKDDFDKLIEYVIEVDNNVDLYNSYFKESIFSNKWLYVFNNPHKIFYKNIVDNQKNYLLLMYS